jgi:hypothetical protein
MLKRDQPRANNWTHLPRQMLPQVPRQILQLVSKWMQRTRPM